MASFPLPPNPPSPGVSGPPDASAPPLVGTTSKAGLPKLNPVAATGVLKGVAEGQRKSLTDPHDPGQRTVTGGTPGTNPRNKPDVSGNLFVKGVPITVPKFDHKKQKDSTDSQGCPARKARNAALPSDSSPPLHSSMASGKPWKLLQTLDESERRTAIRYL